MGGRVVGTTTLEESKHALNGTPVPLGMSVSESEVEHTLYSDPEGVERKCVG